MRSWTILAWPLTGGVILVFVMVTLAAINEVLSVSPRASIVGVSMVAAGVSIFYIYMAWRAWMSAVRDLDAIWIEDEQLTIIHPLIFRDRNANILAVELISDGRFAFEMIEVERRRGGKFTIPAQLFRDARALREAYQRPRSSGAETG